MPETNENEELLFGDAAPKLEFTPVDEGEYEVTIVSYRYKTTSTGKEQLEFKLKIREDVEQKFRGRYLWYTITRKDGDRAFNYYFINQLLVATKNCPDYRERFGKEFDEVLQYLMGREFRLTATVREAVDGGKPGNDVDGNSFTESKWNTTHPKMQKVADGVEGKNLDSIEMTDDDLPF